MAYGPPPYYGQPPMYAPAPQPSNPAIVPAVILVVAGVMALLGLLAPMAGFTVMGMTIGINIWGISFMGFSISWWSAPGMPAAQMGLLTTAVIMAILGTVFAFVSCGLMFARKSVGRVLAVLTGLFCILAVVFFWTGLLLDLDTASIGSLFNMGLFPHAGTFTLIIGTVLAFIGAGMFNPGMAMMAPPPMTPYPQYEVTPQYQYQTPPSETPAPSQDSGWPPQY